MFLADQWRFPSGPMIRFCLLACINSQAGDEFLHIHLNSGCGNSLAQIAMSRLEDIKVNSVVRGIVPNAAVTVKHVQMFGEQALEVTYVDGEGKASTQLLFRDQEPNLQVVLQTRPLSFTA